MKMRVSLFGLFIVFGLQGMESNSLQMCKQDDRLKKSGLWEALDHVTSAKNGEITVVNFVGNREKCLRDLKHLRDRCKNNIFAIERRQEKYLNKLNGKMLRACENIVCNAEDKQKNFCKYGSIVTMQNSNKIGISARVRGLSLMRGDDLYKINQIEGCRAIVYNFKPLAHYLNHENTTLIKIASDFACIQEIQKKGVPLVINIHCLIKGIPQILEQLNIVKVPQYGMKFNKSPQEIMIDEKDFMIKELQKKTRMLERKLRDKNIRMRSFETQAAMIKEVRGIELGVTCIVI